MAEPRFHTNVCASFASGGADGTGFMKNASRGGAFVEATTIPRRGERLWLSFEGLDGEVAEAIGIVWWTTSEGPEATASHPGFGVRFIASSGDCWRFLKRLQRAEGA